MKDPVQLLAELLKPPPDSGGVPAAAAPAAIALLAETIRAQARRRRIRRWAAALTAAAALVLAVAGVRATVGARPGGMEVEAAHRALVTRGEASVAAAKGARLEAGERVETTSGGSVRMRFQTGSEVWLEEQSGLELLSTDRDQHLRLTAGRVRAEVARLLPGERFRINTPDTQLEVRGTRFTVEWAGQAACAGQAATRLRVEEGVVWVRHGDSEAEVRAGGVWPPPCAPAVEAPVVRPAPAPPAAFAPSRLAEENRRFGEVLQARQAGRPARALELLELLRRDFPHGQLEEDMAAEEMRLSAGRDPARAQRAARAYLQRFPRGYARAMAQELAHPPR